MGRIVAILILLSLCTTRACGQATQPSSAFTDSVQQLAGSLIQSDDSSLESLVGTETTIHHFNHKPVDSLDHLHAAANGHTVIAVLSYTGMPKTFATDLAAALHEQEGSEQRGLDTLKRQLVPKTPAELKHADETAASWIGNAIRVQPTDLLGIIVLSDTPNPGDTAKPLFVLVRSDGQQIRQLAWGDPRQQ